MSPLRSVGAPSAVLRTPAPETMALAGLAVFVWVLQSGGG